MTSEQEVPACVCPGAIMYLRMASLTSKARSSSRVWAATVRLLPLRGALWPCLSMSALGVCLKGVSHSCRMDVGPGVESCLPPAYLPPDTCPDPTYLWTWRPYFRLTRHRRPWNWTVGAAGCDAPTATVSGLPRLPSTAKGQGRLQCNGPGIEVQLSVSKRREFKDTRQKSATPCLRSGAIAATT